MDPATLTAHDLDHYRQQGFLLVEDCFTADELQALVDAATALTDTEVSSALSDWRRDASGAPPLCIHQPQALSPVIRDWTSHPRIADILAQLVGAHLPADWWDGSVKCMQSMFFYKRPGMPGQAWHQDEIYIPTRDRSLTGAWIAVDDADEENGCLWVLPGSHRAGVLYDQREHDNPDQDEAAESVGFDDTAQIPVPVRAGSVLFFNGYLLHRSGPNRSAERSRRVLVSHYMTAQSLLPWHRPPEGVDVARHDHRRIMLVAGHDPYPWKSTDPFTAADIHVRRARAPTANS